MKNVLAYIYIYENELILGHQYASFIRCIRTANELGLNGSKVTEVETKDIWNVDLGHVIKVILIGEPTPSEKDEK